LIALAVAFAVLYPGAREAESAEAGKALNTRTGETYGSLSAAFKAANAGDRIEIGSGTYRERILIEKPLALRGVDTGGGRPLLDGSTSKPRPPTPPIVSGSSGFPSVPPRSAAVIIQADNVQIEGVAITTRTEPRPTVEYGDTISEEGCLLLLGNDTTVRDNLIEGCEKGIALFGGRGNVITDNVVRNNFVYGIALINTRDNHVLDNQVESNTLGGIVLETVMLPQYFLGGVQPMVEGNEVLRNRVAHNGIGGIGIGLARRNVIAENEVAENGGAKVISAFVIAVGAPSAAIVPGGQRGFGIELTCGAYENRIEQNKIARNDDNGILILAAERNQFTRNEVEGSVFGMQGFNALANVFQENQVFGNSGYGITFPGGRATSWPSADNLLFGNDLVDNGVNAFDTSGAPFMPPGVQPKVITQAYRERLVHYAQVNRWDDGQRGNHYVDFDEAFEGFVDENWDGVSEVPHAIPGGRAVDHFPLGLARVTGPAGSAAEPIRRLSPRAECRANDVACAKIARSLSASPCSAG
jgi:parallel beta-helix repeat protein